MSQTTDRGVAAGHGRANHALPGGLRLPAQPLASAKACSGSLSCRAALNEIVGRRGGRGFGLAPSGGWRQPDNLYSLISKHANSAHRENLKGSSLATELRAVITWEARLDSGQRCAPKDLRTRKWLEN